MEDRSKGTQKNMRKKLRHRGLPLREGHPSREVSVQKAEAGSFRRLGPQQGEQRSLLEPAATRTQSFLTGMSGRGKAASVWEDESKGG